MYFQLPRTISLVSSIAQLSFIIDNKIYQSLDFLWTNIFSNFATVLVE